MLHEVLLSLSGVPSPIWKELKDNRTAEAGRDDSFLSYTSPAEKAMLNVLADLVDLHINVRDATAEISRSHASPTCRAVSNRIRTKHLGAFTNKVVQVEASILEQDAKYVGAYKIVPLSTILTEFEPWTRPLTWLHKTVEELRTKNCSAAQIMRYLRQEGHTGYSDIKDLANDNLVAAQQAWMQGLLPWILYGQLPHFGKDDFMISTLSTKGASEFTLNNDLVPDFVPQEAADTILAIGRALNQIKSRGGTMRDTSTGNVYSSLLPSSLEQLQSLDYPLQKTALSNVLGAINDSIFSVALPHLLPSDVILRFFSVMQEYVLLRNGEFSASLIRQADDALQSHQQDTSAAKPVRKIGKLDGLVMSDSEIASILDKTWSEMTLLEADGHIDHSTRDAAVGWLRLKSTSASLPVSTLLPMPVCLHIDLPPESSLHIFVVEPDIERYHHINSYLISLHRAQAQLSKLWKLPAYRRCHPAPLGPPLSASRQGQQRLAIRRAREGHRNAKMRANWACASQILFLLSEIGNYFHGEIISNSWKQLQTWLENDENNWPSSSRISSRPTTAASKQSPGHWKDNISSTFSSSQAMNSCRRDPRSIARAHQQYLKALYHSLLLEDATYISLLRELLTSIGHFVALFQRLQVVWEGLDLQEDEGIMDALSNHTKDEKELLKELSSTNKNLSEQLHELVGAIREADRQNDLADMSTGVATMGFGNPGGSDFEPWKGRTLDRLLMKLDSLAGSNDEDRFEDALVDADED